MFDQFRSETIDVGDGIHIFARVGGSGPPLLLLHGFPQTHICWHRIAPALAAKFTVVATDLRGYGASSKPAAGPDHAEYSKRSMAQDQVRVMAALGFERFHLAGHDRGGRVAHRLCLDHPERVYRLAVLDIAPTASMYAATDREFAEAYYHWFFLIQPFDLPERLIAGEAEYYVRRTLESWSRRQGAFSEEVIRAYVSAFTSPGAIHSACEDYRASATIDLQHDLADMQTSHRLTQPMLVLWGGRGVVGRQFDVLGLWRDRSNVDVSGKALDCGHFLPEEMPDDTLAELEDFFRKESS
jgi:haloacetate dehalogenase